MTSTQIPGVYRIRSFRLEAVRTDSAATVRERVARICPETTRLLKRGAQNDEARIKVFPRVGSSLAFSRGFLQDLKTSGLLWQRTGISGDATLEFRKDLRLHVRHENTLLKQRMIAREVSNSTLQLETRISLYSGALSLSPALHIRRQAADPPDLNLAAMRFLLLAGVRLPRYVPGIDLRMNFASHHVHARGRQSQNGAEFSMRWNLKRM